MTCSLRVSCRSCCIVLLMLAPWTATGLDRGPDRGLVFQVSTLAALLEGHYDGQTSFREVRKRGDFGLGTFDRLDGEMVAVDGKFYQVRVDGVPRRVDDDQRTPFAAVTFFAPEDIFAVGSEASCVELQAILTSRFPSDMAPAAIRVKGHFAALTTRSVPAQTRPYVPLEVALQQQVEFGLRNVDATMVGFWMPAALGDVNVAGFHFHAIADDGRAGGHVLDCRTAGVDIEIDYLTDLQIQFGEKNQPGRPPVTPGPADLEKDTSVPLSRW